ncbi:MAG: prenyltransferase/squalene oxidase repeat-containing protein [Verrucomicrobiota bacterium]
MIARFIIGCFCLAAVLPVQADTREDAIQRGIDHLVETQNKDGSWGSARQTKGLNIYAPVPSAHQAFRAAVTAMAVAALIESGFAIDGAAKESLERGEAYLLEELPEVRRASADALYNVWAHAYGIEALVNMYARHDGDLPKRERIVSVINGQIKRLGRYTSIDGGWGYYDFRAQTAKPSSSSMPFTTATALIVLKEASEIPGVEVPEVMVERALAAIQRQRKPDETYLYGEYLRTRPMRDINRGAGSLARTQACSYALRIWGDESVTDEIVTEWLNRLKDRQGWLDMGRKRPIPHESWAAVAGYFYYYGHYYAGKCIALLPDDEQPKQKAQLQKLILDRQDADGSWWDFPFYSYHQPYGTAYAVMTLVSCR